MSRCALYSCSVARPTRYFLGRPEIGKEMHIADTNYRPMKARQRQTRSRGSGDTLETSLLI